MGQDNKNRWLNEAPVQGMINSADLFLLERRRMIAIMKSLYKNALREKTNPKVLDLGSGDGKLIHELLLIDGSIEGTLVDGSPEMLEKAQKRLAEYRKIKYISMSFQELLEKNPLEEGLDFVVSSLALHHLDMEEIKAIFSLIYNKLASGGCFVNLEAVRPPSLELEEWYLQLWQDWLIERGEKTGNPTEFIHVPDRFKNSHEGILDTLDEQLGALKKSGFRDVDCFYKYGIFTVYGGFK